MDKKTKKYLGLFLPIFTIIFLIASTDTIYVIGGLAIYGITILLIFFISIFTDLYLQTNFKRIAAILIGVSLLSVALGVSTYSFQQKLNLKTAEKFIVELENYKNKNGEYPKSDSDIELPDSRNGLLIEKFSYSLMLKIKSIH